MGNRIIGFLTGVGLTALLSIYTTSYIRNMKEFTAAQVRDVDYSIKTHILQRGEPVKPAPPINRRLDYTFRPSIWETATDIWNDEIITMVNWVYSINWYQVGLDADRKIVHLTDKVANSVREKK